MRALVLDGDGIRLADRPEPDATADTAVVAVSVAGICNTDLELVLRSRGIRTVIMTGVATNVCVETTARQAFLKDYYVVFTSDCTATYSQPEHDTALANIDSEEPPVAIEDSSERALLGFYRALEQTQRKKPDAVTRILHFGDSIVVSDYVSGTLRRKFQEQFGDAGWFDHVVVGAAA